ncbi:ribokinase [Pectinatus sottacetonis]|uniref:ribokinase n=1 Tax=Pectinatus sottacetonis TaxID=1002795 RepID=UPI0018C641F9|nr:ribokinase [Pectinatus sottacetonis]
MKKILIIGSLNMDFAIHTARIPAEGETVTGETLSLIPGGKGANQAYTAGKLGAEVSMIGSIGNDIYGKKLLNNLKKANVKTSGIKIDTKEETGKAFIAINNTGENSIIVIPGANNALTCDWIDENEDKINDCDIVVIQLEIPLKTVYHAITTAKAKGKIIILDPAPAVKNFSQEIMAKIDIIKPNETELSFLTDMPVNSETDIKKAAQKLLNMGVNSVITTFGSHGAYLIEKNTFHHFPALKVKAIDSTAAGDSFTAAIAVSLTKSPNIIQAVNFATKTAAIVVTRKGAQSSIPSLNEVINYKNNAFSIKK